MPTACACTGTPLVAPLPADRRGRADGLQVRSFPVEGEAVACDQASMPSFEDAAVNAIAIDHTPKGKAHKDNEAGRSLAILARTDRRTMRENSINHASCLCP
jgi:hypothetical protein